MLTPQIKRPLALPREMWAEMLTHLRGQLPGEGCGLVAGCNGVPIRFYPCANAHASPLTRYRVDDRDLLAAVRDIDQRGWDLLATLHSHPHSEAYPSATDVREAHYPESLYLICSLTLPDQPVLRGFWIVNGQVAEHVVEVA